MRRLNKGLAGLACAALFASGAQAYVVGGASQTITPGSGCWAWDANDCVADFRAALENPANFGPGGIVEETITTVTLNAVNAGTLAGVDMFIAPWIRDDDGAVFSAAVVNFFLNGGDLFLLDDSAGWDPIGEALGIPTTPSDGSVSNGGAPLFDGPFGVANDVTQHYQVGQLSAADIAANNGHIGGTNASGQVTSAYWSAGEYAAGAGALFIIADVDMIATTLSPQCPVALCGADYDNMNDNAIYALNTFQFLKSTGGTSVPEPGTLAVLALGLGGFAFGARRRRS